MNINITKEIIDKLRAQDFYPDEMFSLLFVLKGLNENEVDLLDAYDDLNTSKRGVLSYQKLYRLGLIDKNKEGSALFFKLTEKGLDLLKSLEPEIVLPNKICIDWINDWNNLFPEKNQNGILRSDLSDIVPRMVKFIKTYKYTKEIIFAATKAYLSKESSKNHMYTKRTMYFIDKRGEGSLLAAWCKLVAEYKAKTGVLTDGSRTEVIQTVN